MKHFLVFIFLLCGIVVQAQPAPPVATYTSGSAFGSNCPGSLGNLSATGCGGTYTWSVQGNGSLAAGNIGANVYAFIGGTSGVYESYAVTCTDGTGTSAPSNVVGYTVGNVPPVPNLSASVSQQCQGGIVTLTASGCNTASGVNVIQWVMNGGTSSDGQGDRCNYQSECTRSLYLNQTYTFMASCSDGGANGCQSDNATVTITMLPIPAAPVLSASPGSICAGGSSVLSAAGCGGTVNWSTGAAGISITVNPNANTTYTATCTENGCVGPAGSVAVTVNSLPPSPSLTGPGSPVCPGSPATLNASGCGGTITWNTGATGASITVNPNVNTTYTATCSENGCTSTPGSVAVTVHPTPAAPVLSASPASICAGGSSNLTASGCAGTVNWSTGAAGPSITVNPMANATYTATCSENGCTGAAGSVAVTVNPIPAAPTLSAIPASICAGGSSVLSSSGCGGTVTWSTGQTGPSITVNPMVNSTYTATCSENGCTGAAGSVAVTVNQIPATPAVSVISQPTCTNPMGSAVINSPTGAGIQYYINGTPQGGTGLSLGAGTYTVRAEQNGCSSGDATLVINAQPATPSPPGVTITQPTCLVATGSVDASSAGAAMYSVDGGSFQSSGTFGGLAPGTHSVVAQSSAGCNSAATSFVVNAQPATPSAPTATITQPTCLVATGSVTVSAVNATTYSVDGGAFQSGSFAGLAPGTYSVVAQSAAGCVSAVTSFVVNAQPATPSAPTASVTEPTCLVSTGSVNVSSSGAATYSVDGGSFQSLGTFSGLAPGTHSVIAQSAAGCNSASSSFVIAAQPATPAAPTATVTQPTCLVATGSVNASASGAATYSVDGGADQASGTFVGLAPGTHSVTAKSSAGCISGATSFVINAQPATPAAPTATVTQPTCLVATGSVTVSASGATTYSVDGGAFQSGTFAALAPGTHSVVAQSAEGCVSGASSFVVNAQPTTPSTPTASVTNPTCTVAVGSAVVSSAGATLYSVDGNAFQASPNYSGLAPGTYSVAAQSASGCITAAGSFVVAAQPATPAAPAASVTTQPTCLVSTGTVVVSSPTGAGISYFANGAAQSGASFNLPIGTHSITVQQNGCESAATSVVVSTPAGGPATPTLTVSQQPTCTDPTGTVTILSPVGAGIEYSVSGGGFGTSTTYTGLNPSTTYSVVARFISTGCASSAASIAIDGLPANPSVATLSLTQPTCLVSTGSATVSNPSGGQYAYSLDGSAYQAGTSFGSLATGNHTITVRDNSTGCVSGSSTFVVNAQPATPSAPTATITQPTCLVATGLVTVSSSGAATYSVDGGAFQSGSFSGLAPGTHSVVAQSSAGCISAATSFVIDTQPATPAAPTATITQPTCLVATGSVTVSASGAATYSVDGGADQPSGTFAGLAPGTHSVTAKSSAGCVSSATSFVIDAQPATPAAPTATVTQPTCSVSTGSVTVSTSGASTYSVDGGADQASGTFAGLAPGTHSVTAKSSAGCVSAATSFVIAAQPIIPAAPTASVTTQPTCFVSTGTVVVSSPTGAGITYLANSVAQSGASFNLPIGTHSIAVQQNGCTSAATSVVVNAPSGGPATPTVTVSVQPTCTTPTGTVVVSAPTGADIEYSLDGGAFGSTTTYSGLNPSTTHTVVARFISTGCTSSAGTASINQVPANPSVATVSLTLPTCLVAVGSATVTSPTGAQYSYSNGGAYQAGTSFSGLPTSNYAIVVRDNSTGCESAGSSFAIAAQPATPVAPTATVTNPTCSVATGSVDASSAGATLYSVDGGSFQASGTFSGLASGSHLVIAQSAAGCNSAATSFVVNAQPATPAAPTATVTQPTCAVATGSVTVSSAGAATYSVDGGAFQASGTFAGLASGNHSVVAQSAAGCNSAATSFVIAAQPATPAAPTATVTQPTCIVATGSVDVSSAGATTYSVDGGVDQASEMFTRITPGTHSVTAKSSAGCVSAATSFVINAQPVTPAAPTASVTTQPTCLVSTGTVVVSAPTGAGITYLANGVAQAGASFNLPIGTHSITVQQNGCTSAATSVVVNAPSGGPATPTLAVSQQPTCTTPTGTLVVSAPVGADIEYSLDGGAFGSATTFTGLNPSTTHSVIARFISTGCSSAAVSASINAIPANPATPTVAQTNLTCDAPLGSLTVTAPVGASYQYSNGGAYQASAVFAGLSAATYPVTVKDVSTGCISSAASVVLLSAPAVTAATAGVSVQPTCVLATGTITVSSPTGANLRYSVNGSTYQAGLVFAGLSAGAYGVTVKDVTTGCVSTAVSLVVNPQPLTPAAPAVSIASQPTCFVATGAITVSGTDTYSFDGTNYQVAGTYTGLAAGTYAVTAKSLAGCISAATSVTITAQPATPSAPALSASSATICNGTASTLTAAGCTGTVTWSTAETGSTIVVNPASTQTFTAYCSANGCQSANGSVAVTVNAVPMAPAVSVSSQPTCITPYGTLVVSAPTGAGISYLANGVAQSGASFTLVAGSYIITAQQNDCNSTGTPVVVNAVAGGPATPTVIVSVQPTCTTPTGTLVVSAPVGADLEYSLDGGAFGMATTFTGLNPSTTHTVVARFISTGCVSSGASASINAIPANPVTPTVAQTNLTCDAPLGSLTVTTPTGAYEYSNGGVYQASSVFAGLTAATYPVTVKDVTTGCISSSASVALLSAPAVPAATAGVSSQPTCSVATGTITVSTPTGANLRYSVDGSTYQAGLMFAGLSAGTYPVTVKDVSTGCISTAVSLTINIQPATPSVPVLTATPAALCEGSSTTLTATGCTGTLMWSTAQAGAGIVVSPVVSTTYTATCSANGCVSLLGSVVVTVNPIPTAPTLTASAPVVNPGIATTLTATGCSGTVNWSTGGVGASIVVSPVANTTYTATCTMNACLSGSAWVAVSTDACFGKPVSASYADNGNTRCNGPASEKEQTDGNPCSASFGLKQWVVVQPYGCSSPIALADNTTTAFNTPVTVGVLSNDTGKDGTPASLTNVTVSVVNTTGGTTTLNPDGTVSFTPTAGFTGNATVTYTICDVVNTTACSSALVTIAVRDVCFGKPTSVSLLATGVTRCNGPALERELRDANACSPTFGSLSYEVVQPYGCASPTALTDAVSTSFNTPVTISVLGNDKGKDNSPASLTNITVSVVNTTGGTTTLNPDGTLSFTPTVGFTGTATVVYQICDVVDASKCSSASVVITVRDACFGKPTSVSLVDTGITRCNGVALEKEQRDANPCSAGFGKLTYVVVQPYGCASPTAINDNTTSAFNTPITVSVLGNDLGKDRSPASLTNVTPALVATTGGTAVINPNGTLSFTPKTGFTGVAVVTYQICDVVDPTKCSVATVSVTVQDACFGKSVAANYTDTGVTRCNGPAKEKEQMDTNSCSPTFNATQWVVVQPYGCASPTAVTDVTSTSFNTPITVSVLTNDKGKDGTPARLSNVTVSVQTTTGGTSTLNPDGTVSFTPTVGVTGTATVVYQICDKIDATKCSSASVVIVVRDACFGKPTSVSLVDTGVTRCNGPALEREQRDANSCSPTFGNLSYVVVEPYGCASPTAVADLTSTGFNQAVTVSILTNDKAKDGSGASLSSVTTSILGTTNGTSYLNSDGTLTFTPTAGFSGTATVSYQICDVVNTTACSSAVVTVVVRDVCFGKPTSASFVETTTTRCNGPASEVLLRDVNPCSSSYLSTKWLVVQPFGCASPTAVSDMTSTSFNTPTTVSILTNDKGKDGSPASLSNVTPSVVATTGGTATLNTDGTVSFTPTSGFTGVGTVVYTICDVVDATKCSSATVSITVRDACYGKPTSASYTDTGVTRCNGSALEKEQKDRNTCSLTAGLTQWVEVDPFGCAPPVARPDAATTPHNSPIRIVVLTNDNERDGVPASTTNVGNPVITATTNGTASVNADGTLSFTPTAGFSGTATITYQICQLATSMLKANEPVKCSSTTVTINVLDICFGKPTSTSYVASGVTRCNGPALEIEQIDRNSCSSTFNLNKWIVVQPYGCASPTAVSDFTSTSFNTPVSVTILGNDKGKDGNPASLTNVTLPVITAVVNGSASVGATGVLSYTPTAGFTGVAVITYRICDALSTSALSTSLNSTSAASSTNCSTASVTIYVGESPCAPGQGRPLQVTRISLNCYTAKACIETCGGDGTPIQYFGIGATSWSNESCVMLGDDMVHYDPKVMMFRIIQSGKELTVPFDLVTASQSCPSDSRPWNRATPGSPAPPGVTVIVPGNPTVATGQPLALLQPIYNCVTGAISFRFSGGDGSPVEFMSVGVTGWTTNQIVFADAGVRIDQPTITITARQGGVEVSRSIDLKAYCIANPLTAPTASTGVSATVSTPVTPDPTQPGSATVTPTPTVTTVVGGVFRLIEPYYNCQTGAFTFRSGGANGGTVEYMAIGITGWTSNPNQAVEAGLRNSNDVQPFLLKARVNGVEVSYNWDLLYFCNQANATPPTVVTVSPPVSPTVANPVSPTVASPPSVSVTAPVVVTATIPIATTVVAVTAVTAPVPVVSGNGLELVDPLYNCETGQITFRTKNGNGSKIEFMAIGVTGWTVNPVNMLEAGLRADGSCITIQARQMGVEVGREFCFRAFCLAAAGQRVTEPVSVSISAVEPIISGPLPVTFVTGPPRVIVSDPEWAFPVAPAQPTTLVLQAPFYDCATGRLVFNYSGGTGTEVEFMAVGITGWSTNPNQVVDAALRTATDVGVFTLMARQGNQVVKLDWNLRSACSGGARVATTEVPFTVTILGNPVSDEVVEVIVRGEAGQSMRLQTLSVQGALVDELLIENAPVEGHYRLRVGSAAGVYLLRVKRGDGVETVKVIKL